MCHQMHGGKCSPLSQRKAKARTPTQTGNQKGMAKGKNNGMNKGKGGKIGKGFGRQSYGKGPGTFSGNCNNCWAYGHKAIDCPQPRKNGGFTWLISTATSKLAMQTFVLS